VPFIEVHYGELLAYFPIKNLGVISQLKAAIEAEFGV
jgi:hypothetical protein